MWQYEEAGFMTVANAMHLELLDIDLVHDPAKSLVRRDKLWICGHVHNLFPKLMRPNLVNVSVDVWDFKPASLDEILELTKNSNV
jgi:calcineurin-like phosphoesterase family protein